MVKLSTRMMDWRWKYHLECSLSQKKNSSIFSKKVFLNGCNYIVNRFEIKKIKPNLFFHLSNQPSDAGNFWRSILWENIMPFLWSTHHWQEYFRLLNCLSTTLLTWSYVSTFTLYLVALPCWRAWKISSLFLFHVESAFAGTPNNCATSLLVLSFSSSNKALYLSSRFCSLWSLCAIFPYTRETYSRP